MTTDNRTSDLGAMRKALQFCLDLAEEEYPHQQHGNLGAELVLRHIIRKCRETLAPSVENRHD